MIGLLVRPQTQRERNVVRFPAAVCGEKRCVATLKTAVWQISRPPPGVAPVYLKKLSSFNERGSYNLTSNIGCELKVPKQSSRPLGTGPSHVLAPHALSNTLPSAIRSIWSVQGFKQSLKTFWCRLAFVQWTNSCTVIAIFYFHFLWVHCLLCFVC